MARKKSNKPSFYAVATGRGGPQIFETWAEAEAAVKGVPHALHKRFDTRADAQTFIRQHGSHTIRDSFSRAETESNSSNSGTSQSTTATATAPAPTTTATSAATVPPQQNAHVPPARSQSTAPLAGSRPSIQHNTSTSKAAPTQSSNSNSNSSSRESHVTMYFDGGARGNPGIAGAGMIESYSK